MDTSLLCALRGRRQLLVAYSGGLDSTVLLHQLVRLREACPALRLRAIHVHHGISPNADRWAAHCQAMCHRWQVPLELAYVELREEGLGVEAQARKARYQAFEAALAPGEALVTAQHLDDQCETLLLALKRGSGPAGLAAMPAELPFAGGVILRPLLNTPRAQLEAWADRHELLWIDDESNQDDRYDRNFLRLRILPALEARWPHFTQAAARSAQLCGEQEQLLDELLAPELAALMEGKTLAIAPLESMSERKRAALLRRWLAALNAPMPARATLQRIWDEVAQSREDASPRLKVGDNEARRYQGRLWWIKARRGQRQTIIPWPDASRPLLLPQALGALAFGSEGDAVRAPRAQETLSVRFSAPGTLYIVGRDRGRPLKKLWQELQVPPWRRETTPILFYDEQPICAPGLFVTREGQAQNEPGLRLAWHKEHDDE
ncbi:tRNA lysidine(34) synthetase TilS [Cronobacter dublinensis]|uniref:tRNA lysidine(34) synthetase TilS n=1 Tax=Cronobacter dublinensis TaxID=413497 RepID=UPI000CFD6C41|nr:tRNA lysidine(34) synthetase TilS [Cronobacter dublinensis]